MTKNIEGTVDDDIAAKLAIGEGRQVRAPTELSRLIYTSIYFNKLPVFGRHSPQRGTV